MHTCTYYSQNYASRIILTVCACAYPLFSKLCSIIYLTLVSTYNIFHLHKNRTKCFCMFSGLVELILLTYQNHLTIDRKYFVRKNFVVFNFRGWSQPQKIKYESYFVRNFAYEYRGHSYHGYAQKHQKKKEETSLSYLKRCYKAIL